MKFLIELPEVINETHNMLIVASQIDESSERIVRYLSDTYGVSINLITFEFFRSTEGREFVARVFLIEPELVEYKAQTRGTSKRTPPSTVEEICARADEEGIGEGFRKILHAAQKHNLYPRPYTACIMYTPPSNRTHMLFTVWLRSKPRGGHTLGIKPEAFAEYYPVEEETVVSILGADRGRDAYENADEFVTSLDRLFEIIETGRNAG